MTQISPNGTPSPSHVDFTAIKTRQQATWASGNYSLIGRTLQIVGESLCEAIELRPGATVLDVACGNGNVSLAAARRWAHVTGLDYVPSLLERARLRAEAEELELALVEGDAEALPFEDARFDVALSTFGVMFAPDHRRAAAELLRVVKPGGTIGLANWTPGGFIGELFATVGRHVPPPAGVVSPARWGSEDYLEELFAGARSIQATRREFVFRYESVEHFTDVFRRYYGPTFKAFGILEPSQQARLAADISALAARYNRAEGSFAVPGEYLEVVIDR